MYGAELLHAPQPGRWHTGIREVGCLLAAAGTAGGAQALVARKGGAAAGRVILHRALQTVLLKHLLVNELMVLSGRTSANVRNFPR